MALGVRWQDLFPARLIIKDNIFEQPKPIGLTHQSSVLIVEDSKTASSRISDLVRQTGFDCLIHVAPRVEEAWDIVQNAHLLHQRVVLVILDIELEDGQDGLEVLRLMRRDPDFSDIPVVLMTATLQRIKEGMELGARFFMTKDNIGKIPEAIVAQLEVILGAERQTDMLREEALIDSKSGLGNDRKLAESLRREFGLARRMAERDGHSVPLSLILLDADRFKQINDLRGHSIGDRTIRVIGDICREFRRQDLRLSDTVCRAGGDEFAMVLPNTDLKGAVVVAQRFWKKVIHLNQRLQEVIPDPMPLMDDKGFILTFSIGVVCLYPGSGMPDSEIEVMYQKADAAMYQSKECGGHLVCASDCETTLEFLPL